MSASQYTPMPPVPGSTPSLPQKKRGKKLIFLGISLIIVGLAGAIALIASSVIAIANTNLQRGIMPGKMVVRAESGENTVFHETRSHVEGRLIQSNPSDVNNLTFKVTSVDTGQELAVSFDGMNTNYSSGAYEGHSVMRFRADQPGEVIIEGIPRADSNANELVLAVGEVPMGRTLAGIFGGIAVGLACGVLGLALIIVGAIRRKPA